MIGVNAPVGRNRALFDRMPARALEGVADPHVAARGLGLVPAAADFAWYNPTGRFASAELERVCATVGSRLRPAPPPPAPSDGRRRFLHVFSEAHHSAGGHVRFPWRWIALAPHSTHSVAITNQPLHEGPSPVLVANAEATGGSVEVISAHHRSFLGRAQRLRALTADADVVVLHIHPYDAVATAALATAEGPPRFFVNHADHVFWLGVSVTDTLVNLRQSGADLAVAVRGVDPGRSTVLPLIVDAPDRTQTRDEAKAALGIAPTATVLFTAAHGYKYVPIDDFHFLEMVGSVLRRSPSTILLTAGPGKDGSWAVAKAELGDQLVDMGHLSDTRLPDAAADIYLDPYPFSSCTSFLQAAAHGSPVVNFSPRGPEAAVLDSRDYADEGVILRTSTVREYQDLLLDLVDDPLRRAQEGRRARAWVQDRCTTASWPLHLDRLLVDRLTAPRLGAQPQVPERRVGVLDQMLLSLHERTGMSQPVDRALRAAGCDPALL